MLSINQYHNIVIIAEDISDISSLIHPHKEVVQLLSTLWKCLKTHTKRQILMLQKNDDCEPILQFLHDQASGCKPDHTSMITTMNINVISWHQINILSIINGYLQKSKNISRYFYVLQWFKKQINTTSWSRIKYIV